MEGALSLLEHVTSGSTEDNGAGLSQSNSCEADDLVLSDDDLLDQLARSDLDKLGVVERRHDLCSCHQRQSLNAFKIGVLNGHDTVGGKVLLGEVVDELTVDEAVDTVADDLLALGTHTGALSVLDFSDLGDRVDLDLGAIDLDLVGVHGGVGDEDAGVFDALGLADTDLLLEDEALFEVRVEEGASGLLDDVDGVEVSASLETEHGVDAQLGKVVLVGVQHLGAQRRSGNVDQVLPESLFVVTVIEGDLRETLSGDGGGDSPSFNDELGVDTLLDEGLSLTEELSSKNAHRGGSITDLLVLSLRNLDEDAGGGVVNVEGLEDGGTVVGDSDLVLM
mmetsp:Transcript_56005/g.93095  ORF Transcript_56005/g.93095 Transcript_56005/m.93095 type:complete len:336 (-) Transcript_56005:260-1267(-)